MAAHAPAVRTPAGDRPVPDATDQHHPIRTDNGDNPPLRLVSARVLHPVVRLLFRVPDTKPVDLCYGHRRAPYARYALQLVRREFETATKVSASLGAEEKLPGYLTDPAYAAKRGKGSVRLWIALAAVVGVLLWVVARLLPKGEAEKEVKAAPVKGQDG